MRRKALANLATVIVLLALSTDASARRMIRGRVLDAESGEPIGEAAVYIYWGVTKGLPRLSYGKQVEVGEDLTDAEGQFKIPKYSTLFKHYYMAIYKKGYVCWSSRKIFPTYEERKGFRLKDGVIIELERFNDEYSLVEHARFTRASQVGISSKYIFDKATESEQQLLYRIAQEKRAAQKAQWKRDAEEEKAFIDCMRRMGKGRYHIRDFCGGIWGSSSRSRKLLIGAISTPNSDISKAMAECGVTIEFEEESDFPNIYIIKK